MCDYSMITFPNRLPEKGEDLITYRFPAGPLGFVSLSDWRELESQPRQGFWPALWQNLFNRPKTHGIPAVCIPPGACLMLEDIPARIQHHAGVRPDEVVIFTELTTMLNSYRDAIQFRNGRHVLLQELAAGQRATVLDLSSTEAVAAYAEWLKES
ncbi:MAG: hypothetical protein ACRD22_06200 [Terriglobia bacterium]